MEKFVKFIAVVLAIILITIINGFVASKLWLWFVVPTFQIQPLSVVEAIGILCLISFIKAKRDKTITDNEKPWEEIAEIVLFTIVKSGLSLLIGWIITLFM